MFPPAALRGEWGTCTPGAQLQGMGASGGIPKGRSHAAEGGGHAVISHRRPGHIVQHYIGWRAMLMFWIPRSHSTPGGIPLHELGVGVACHPSLHVVHGNHVGTAAQDGRAVDSQHHPVAVGAFLARRRCHVGRIGVIPGNQGPDPEPDGSANHDRLPTHLQDRKFARQPR